ncbi:MAG TPA: GTP cyclohydrolase II, partial [Novosphingobium sp.]|nr:GTP cyclohydrolase II [Novosphingobium sp.]
MRGDSRAVALALDALRHGWAIRVGEAFTLVPADTGFGADVRASRMLISGARAATLNMANQRDAAEPDAPVMIRAAEPFDLPLARAIADPALDLAHPMKGPFAACAIADAQAAVAAMELARLAGILPAFLIDPAGVEVAQAVSPADLADWKDPRHLAIAS